MDAKVKKALNLKILRFPPSLPVVRLEVEDYTDWTGDPALKVQVILDESTDVEHFDGQAVSDLMNEIRESLRKHGITLFPYISLAKQSELAAVDED
jgi:hypothetical protein